MGKLTANEVKAALTKPGTYGDGDGLFLKVSRTGGASWLLRVQHEGKRRDIGLGSAKLVTLAAARAKAAEARKATREDGRDLVAERRKAKVESITFCPSSEHLAQIAAWARANCSRTASCSFISASSIGHRFANAHSAILADAVVEAGASGRRAAIARISVILQVIQ